MPAPPEEISHEPLILIVLQYNDKTFIGMARACR